MNLGESTHEVFVFGAAVVKQVISMVLAWICCYEALEIRPRHNDVHVIIPRNESSVPDCSKKGTESEGIAYAVLAAEGIHVGEYFQKNGMDIVYGEQCHLMRFSIGKDR